MISPLNKTLKVGSPAGAKGQTKTANYLQYYSMLLQVGRGNEQEDGIWDLLMFYCFHLTAGYTSVYGLRKFRELHT